LRYPATKGYHPHHYLFGVAPAVEDSQSRVIIENTPDGVTAVLLGRWTAAHWASPSHWVQATAALESIQRPPNLGPISRWDLRQVQRLDHTGAQVLWNAWKQAWPEHLLVLENQRSTLKRVARFSLPAIATKPVTARHLFFALGGYLFSLGGHVRDGVALIGQLALDVVQLVRHPLRGPWRDVSGHLYRIGATALPITALVGFLIGVVLAYLMSQQLRTFGASTLIVNILGMALVRELGPALAAILIAGRSGSAITAQIGVMRVTEELDAMRVMGISQGFRLVLPRVIALCIAMPLLAAWTTAAGLLGGMLAADVVSGITPAYFIEALPRAVKLENLWLAMAKSTVFGLAIALIGCHFGLRVKPNTESLGEGTTASVVTAITTVLLIDAVFAIVFKKVGL
jgi:phospholipid/cholesterol/gamma-HCH transport system permease protein